jgi:hypothetical protein
MWHQTDAAHLVFEMVVYTKKAGERRLNLGFEDEFMGNCLGVWGRLA